MHGTRARLRTASGTTRRPIGRPIGWCRRLRATLRAVSVPIAGLVRLDEVGRIAELALDRRDPDVSLLAGHQHAASGATHGRSEWVGDATPRSPFRLLMA